MNEMTIGPGLVVEVAGTKLEFLRKVGEDLYFEQCESGAIHTFTFNQFLQGLIDASVRRLDVINSETTIKSHEVAARNTTLNLPVEESVDYLRRVTYAEAFVERGIRRAFRSTQVNVIRQIAEEISDRSPPTPGSVLAWASRLRRSGGNREVLAGRRAGRPDLPQVTYEDLGNNPDPHEAIIERGLKSYFDPNVRTISGAYENYSIEFDAAIKGAQKYKLTTCRKMSDRQFERRIHQQLIPFELVAHREGKVAAEKQFRNPRGPRRKIRPMEEIQVDDAALRLFVIDDESGMPLGPAWWTAMRCASTKYVVGFYIYFEPASVATFLGALRHSLSPRDYMTKLFPTIKGQYPLVGLGRKYVFDRAKYNLSKPMLAALSGNNVDVQGVKKYTPWAKFAIEGLHHLIQLHVTSRMNGHIPQDRDMFRAENPKNYAVVSLKMLVECIHVYIVDVLHQKPNKQQKTPNELIKMHQTTSPIRFPPHMDRLNIVTGLHFEAKPNNHGLSTHYLEYASQQLNDLMKRLPKKAKLKFVISPGNITVAYVWDPFQEIYFDVPNREPEYVRRLTFYQHKLIARRIRAENKKVTRCLLVEYKKAWIAQFERDKSRARPSASVSKTAASGVNSNAAIEGEQKNLLHESSMPSETTVENAEHLIVPFMIDLPISSSNFDNDWGLQV